MMVELDSLENGEGRFSIEFAPADIDLGDERARLIGEVKVECRVDARRPVVAATGTLAALLETDCSRCLEPFRELKSIEFNVSFVTENHFADGHNVELEDDDLALDVFNGRQIDIASIVREQILLDVPLVAVCGVNCAGICPCCGRNRNEDTCECGDAGPDPRWAVLKEIK